jgi:hypothetical protein
MEKAMNTIVNSRSKKAGLYTYVLFVQYAASEIHRLYKCTISLWIDNIPALALHNSETGVSNFVLSLYSIFDLKYLSNLKIQLFQLNS